MARRIAWNQMCWEGSLRAGKDGSNFCRGGSGSDGNGGNAYRCNFGRGGGGGDGCDGNACGPVALGSAVPSSCPVVWVLLQYLKRREPDAFGQSPLAPDQKPGRTVAPRLRAQRFVNHDGCTVARGSAPGPGEPRPQPSRAAHQAWIQQPRHRPVRCFQSAEQQDVLLHTAHMSAPAHTNESPGDVRLALPAHQEVWRQPQCLPATPIVIPIVALRRRSW